MCKIFISRSDDKKGFIIFNYLYSRNKTDFTISELKEELLSNYGFDFNDSEIQKTVNSMVDDGMVSQRFGHYKRVSML